MVNLRLEFLYQTNKFTEASHTHWGEITTYGIGLLKVKQILQTFCISPGDPFQESSLHYLYFL